jgi:hypothetical protein
MAPIARKRLPQEAHDGVGIESVLPRGKQFIRKADRADNII